jgi:hypothetical protein
MGIHRMTFCLDRGARRSGAAGASLSVALLAHLLLTACTTAPEVALSTGPDVATRAQSDAVSRIVAARITHACSGAAGRTAPGGVILADVTGNGRQDIVVNHYHIECIDNPAGASSGYCGFTGFCAVDVILNEEYGFSAPIELATWGAVTHSPARPRVLVGSNRQGAPRYFVWTGSRFEERSS